MPLTLSYPQKIIGFLADKLSLKKFCFICKNKNNFAICSDCEKELEKIKKSCYGCGINLNNSTLNYCGKCLTNPFLFDRVYPLYDYDSIKNLIFEFKYNKNLAIGKFFSHKIYQFYQENNLDYDVIIPLPLHKKRLRKRGFNQASELAKLLPNVDYFTATRDKYTKNLNKLKAQDRIKELKNAFKVKDLSAKNILIVDDILTTASSTNELSKTIRKYYKDNNLQTPKIDLLVLARVNNN